MSGEACEGNSVKVSGKKGESAHKVRIKLGKPMGSRVKGGAHGSNTSKLGKKSTKKQKPASG